MSKEINDKVATHVMGWECFTVGYFSTDSETPRQRELHDWMCEVSLESVGEYYINVDQNFWVEAQDWRPSEDIAAAWEVVEHLNNAGIGRLQLTRMGWKGSPAQSWRVTFFRDAVSVNSESRADTAPMAICMAALKAAGVEVGDG